MSPLCQPINACSLEGQNSRTADPGSAACAAIYIVGKDHFQDDRKHAESYFITRISFPRREKE